MSDKFSLEDVQGPSDERYVVVTATSTHRMRYCVPWSELQKMTPNVKLTHNKAITWAGDEVIVRLKKKVAAMEAAQEEEKPAPKKRSRKAKDS